MAMQTIFESNQPSTASLALVNSSIQEVTPEEGPLLDWHRKYGANHAVRLALDLDILKRTVDVSGKVLEIGSAPLIFTQAAARTGYDIIGCDIAPERYANAIGRNALKVIKCNVEQDALPFIDNFFDAVVFNEIFEHLRINPVFTLKEVLRVLKPSGTLMLSSPNLRSLQGLINFLLHNRAFSCSANPFLEFNKLATLGHMGHVREYTSTEVREFLRDIGFSVTELIYRGRYKNKRKELLAHCFPKLRPFISYVAIKPAGLG